MSVIDVHTHMLGRGWFEMLRRHGGPHYEIRPSMMANINGRSPTEPHFAPIWKAIDERALPVLIHPTSPPGTAELDIADYGLVAAVGFMIDTTLAVSRMILDGFFDRYPKLKLIVSHAGATL